jgi:hypothetical protein
MHNENCSIVNANKPLSQKQLFHFNQSQDDHHDLSTPPSPTNDHVPADRSTVHRGTSSEAEDPGIDSASVVTEHTLTSVVTLVDSTTPLASCKNGFPGQGVTPYLKPPLHIDYGTTLSIAPSTFINRGCKILDTPVGSVKIGERCLIGPDFHIYAVTHPLG